jgi:hypothetical protein
MRPDVVNSSRRDTAVGAAARGAGLGLTAVICIAALAATVIAGRIILVEFFPDAGQFLATILS